MKKYFVIIASAVLMLSLSSCVDMLNTSPADQIASGNMWTTEDLAEQGMIGLYRNFFYSSTDDGNIAYIDGAEGYDYQAWIGFEFQTNWTQSGLGILTASADAKSASNSLISLLWKWYYTGIHRINDALESLPKAPLTEAKYESYVCEAKFLRAWYYAGLNKIFQGVPLYLEVVSNSECTKTQSSSTEIWEAVLDDLNYCIENDNFANNTLTSNYGRASKGAAYALRGEVYMWLAWENNHDSSYYQLAVNDFKKVADCGYGLWAGNYIDFFSYENEKDHEMIFPLQYGEDKGYCGYTQYMFGCTECYGGSALARPSPDFIDYFQNADGSTFDWTSRIPEWNDAVFTNDASKREVFFLRDSISLDSDNNVITDYWTTSEAAYLQERVDEIGADIVNKYYLKDGNEDRLRAAYNDRDPRLKDIVLTMYDPWDMYNVSVNGGENTTGKEIRWPLLKATGLDGSDVNYGAVYPRSFYYKKYVLNQKGQMTDNSLRCPTDWPIIRYTDVYLHLCECYIRLGQISDAVSIINEIRSRAGMPSISVGTADEVMEAMRYERRIELAGEGVTFFDEWRWGTYKQMKFGGQDEYGPKNFWGDIYNSTWYWSDIMWPFPAPKSECDRNPNMVKREGWLY